MKVWWRNYLEWTVSNDYWAIQPCHMQIWEQQDCAALGIIWTVSSWWFMKCRLWFTCSSDDSCRMQRIAFRAHFWCSMYVPYLVQPRYQTNENLGTKSSLHILFFRQTSKLQRKKISGEIQIICWLLNITAVTVNHEHVQFGYVTLVWMQCVSIFMYEVAVRSHVDCWTLLLLL
jgi:hypothetical protein